MIDDPTLFVLSKIQQVLEELRVRVMRYNLYELKTSIATLPRTLKDADGIILATTVEWHGIGGFMPQFLDACWLYGDKEKISTTYMCPVVISTTYGEKEGELHLSQAWEILGGLPCSGLSGYIADSARLERSEELISIIEKKAENIYRTINQRARSLPASNQAIRQTIFAPREFSLTPQETEQLSVYNSDERYVQKQKEDIEELKEMFMGMMGQQVSAPIKEPDRDYIDPFVSHFHPQPGIRATYRFTIEGKDEPLIIKVDGNDLDCFYGQVDSADVDLHMNIETMNSIIGGVKTIQHSFMGGGIKKRGDFKLMRILDQLFVFSE